ncbi:MAG: glutathione binding-like protein [Formosimonas sp.]
MKINPNGRIPAIIDKGNNDFIVFESGAIMMYLADKVGSGLLPKTFNERSNVTQWLMFQMGGLGPMMGQANVFQHYFPEKIDAVIVRYLDESKRLLMVLDKHLEHNEYLAGSYSIADIANFCWAREYAWTGISLEDCPNLLRWIDSISQRPAVQLGLKVKPKDFSAEEKQNIGRGMLNA